MVDSLCHGCPNILGGRPHHTKPDQKLVFEIQAFLWELEQKQEHLHTLTEVLRILFPTLTYLLSGYSQIYYSQEERVGQRNGEETLDPWILVESQP